MTEKEKEALRKRNARLENLKISASRFFPKESFDYIKKSRWQTTYLEEYEETIDKMLDGGTDTLEESVTDALNLVIKGRDLFLNADGLDYLDSFRNGKQTRHQILAREAIASITATKTYAEAIRIALDNINVFSSFDEKNRFDKIFEQVISNPQLSPEVALSQEESVENAIEELYLNLKEKIETEINKFLKNNPQYISKKPMMYNMTMWFLSEFSDLGILIKNAFYAEKKDSKLTESEIDEYNKVRNALYSAQKKYIEQCISNRTF